MPSIVRTAANSGLGYPLFTRHRSLGETYSARLFSFFIKRWYSVLCHFLQSKSHFLGCPPSQDACHHQDYYIFSRGSQPKPSFATGILGGGTTQLISIFIPSDNYKTNKSGSMLIFQLCEIPSSKLPFKRKNRSRPTFSPHPLHQSNKKYLEKNVSKNLLLL